MPSARSGQSVYYANGMMYMYGGKGGQNSSTIGKKDFCRYRVNNFILRPFG